MYQKVLFFICVSYVITQIIPGDKTVICNNTPKNGKTVRECKTKLIGQIKITNTDIKLNYTVSDGIKELGLLEIKLETPQYFPDVNFQYYSTSWSLDTSYRYSTGIAFLAKPNFNLCENNIGKKCGKLIDNVVYYDESCNFFMVPSGFSKHPTENPPNNNNAGKNGLCSCYFTNPFIASAKTCFYCIYFNNNLTNIYEIRTMNPSNDFITKLTYSFKNYVEGTSRQQTINLNNANANNPIGDDFIEFLGYGLGRTKTFPSYTAEGFGFIIGASKENTNKVYKCLINKKGDGLDGKFIGELQANSIQDIFSNYNRNDFYRLPPSNIIGNDNGDYYNYFTSIGKNVLGINSVNAHCDLQITTRLPSLRDEYINNPKNCIPIPLQGEYQETPLTGYNFIYDTSGTRRINVFYKGVYTIDATFLVKPELTFIQEINSVCPTFTYQLVNNLCPISFGECWISRKKVSQIWFNSLYSSCLNGNAVVSLLNTLEEDIDLHTTLITLEKLNINNTIKIIFKTLSENIDINILINAYTNVSCRLMMTCERDNEEENTDPDTTITQTNTNTPTPSPLPCFIFCGGNFFDLNTLLPTIIIFVVVIVGVIILINVLTSIGKK